MQRTPIRVRADMPMFRRHRHPRHEMPCRHTVPLEYNPMPAPIRGRPPSPCGEWTAYRKSDDNPANAPVAFRHIQSRGSTTATHSQKPTLQFLSWLFSRLFNANLHQRQRGETHAAHYFIYSWISDPVVHQLGVGIFA